MRLAVAFALLAPATALADVGECVDAADRAQQLRDEGKLLTAREQLAVCGSQACPAAVVKQCVRWLQEVNAEMPTLSFRVRDREGRDVVDVVLLVDGVQRADRLDGRPLAADPGQHVFSFVRGAVKVDESLVIRSGEKNRLVDVALVPADVRVVTRPPPPPPPAMIRFPWSAGVFLGLAVAGGVTTGVLVAVAGSDAGHLRSTCAPGCSQGQVDSVQAEITGANVAMGVGIGMAALAVLFLVVENVRHTPSSTTALLTF